jgi:hypothetical protein
MKKHFFFREYIYYSEFEGKSIKFVATLEVDFNEIEKGLPAGAIIKHDTVKTVIEGGKFVVYGEYTLLQSALEEIAATEAIKIDEVLGNEGLLPSVN